MPEYCNVLIVLAKSIAKKRGKLVVKNDLERYNHTITIGCHKMIQLYLLPTGHYTQLSTHVTTNEAGKRLGFRNLSYIEDRLQTVGSGATMHARLTTIWAPPRCVSMSGMLIELSLC